MSKNVFSEKKRFLLRGVIKVLSQGLFFSSDYTIIVIIYILNILYIYFIIIGTRIFKKKCRDFRYTERVTTEVTISLNEFNGIALLTLMSSIILPLLFLTNINLLTLSTGTNV